MKQSKKNSTVIKSCYSHIGGKFGNVLTARFEEMGWIEREPAGKNYLVTPKGEKEFKKLGIDMSNL